MTDRLRTGRLVDIWRAYGRCPLSTRLRVVGRYLLCPFDRLLKEFPPEGRTLDVGCGDGLLLFLLDREQASGERARVGIDHDEDKLRAIWRLRVDTIEFRHQDVSKVSSDSFDCVSIVDVLYLLPLSCWASVLGHCVRVLKKDGLLIVKEVTNQPRWKHLVASLQEILAIYVIGITKGSHPHFESIDTYRHAIEAAGVQVVLVKRVDAGLPHAHVMFLARKR